jgi:hypothetical protein
LQRASELQHKEERHRRKRGVMANQGAKKRKEENEKHMRMLWNLILICNAIYVVLRLGVRYRSVSWKHGLGLCVTSAAYKLVYDQLAAMAKPSYDTITGELTDGGFDMSTGGLCSYLHDILYITAFVQIASILSDKFWFAYLVIPIFAFYKLWELLLYPFFFQRAKDDVPMDEKERKKMEKMERKANRPKFARTRR